MAPDRGGRRWAGHAATATLTGAATLRSLPAVSLQIGGHTDEIDIGGHPGPQRSFGIFQSHLDSEHLFDALLRSLDVTRSELRGARNLLCLSLYFLGVPRFVIFDYVEATPKRDDHAVAVERLVWVAELARKFGVRIALEFIARSRLLGSLPTALQVIRQSAQPNVGLCLDTFHFHAGVSKVEDLDELRPGEVEHVHFHDVPRTQSLPSW